MKSVRLYKLRYIQHSYSNRYVFNHMLYEQKAYLKKKKPRHKPKIFPYTSSQRKVSKSPILEYIPHFYHNAIKWNM